MQIVLYITKLVLKNIQSFSAYKNVSEQFLQKMQKQ